MSARRSPVDRGPIDGARAAAALALVAAAALVACSPAANPDRPPAGTAVEATAPPEAIKPAVRWEHGAPAGYTVSVEPPGPGVVELDNPGNGCLLQLTRARLPDAAGDDRTATEEALDRSIRLLDGEEIDRRDATLTTPTGPMAAREAVVRSAVGPQAADLRMVLRSSATDRALVGLVHICPVGSLDEAAWATFVAGATLHGATATEF
jgi:hypothetical protein